MARKIKRCIAGWSGMTLALLASLTAAQAGVEILSSTLPQYKPGSVLEDETRFDLPAGVEMRVLMTATGATKTMKGPYKGTAGDYKDRRGWWQRFWNRRDKEPVIGGTRGVLPEETKPDKRGAGGAVPPANDP